MKTSVKVLVSALVLGLSLGISSSYASGDAFVPAPNQYSYIPHIYLFGFTGSTITTKGDILQPIFLRSDRNFFAYGQGNYGYADEDWAKNPWTGSFALGYRQIVANTAVLGAYVFGDYTRTTTDHSIWLVSPGIEALGRAWEFHANGYFPVSKKNWSTTEFASEVGNYDYIHFKGHDQFDAKFKYSEETGPGADAELGRTLFKCHNTLVTGFINGYYFHMQDNTDVRGGGAAITVQPNTYLELSVNGSYDNYAHTVVMLGIQLSLYDLFSNNSKVLNEQDLQRRLFDPIHRGFANLASGSDVRMTGGPRDEETRKESGPVILGHNFLERSNVWFFNGAGLSQTNSAGAFQEDADGTYEHPFTAADFNQQTVKAIYDNTLVTGDFANAYLYFNKGTYNTFDTASVGASFVRLELFPGESMWGRMGDQKGYQMPATGDARPTFIGGLMLDSNTSLNDLMLQNDKTATGFDTGVTIDGATSVGINNTKVGANDNNTGYSTGIEISNGSNVSMSNSTVYGYNAPASGAAFVFGISLDSSTITLGDGNMISATATTGGSIQNNDGRAVAIGLSATNGSVVTMNGSNNAISATAAGGFGINSATATATALEVDNSTATINGNSNSFSATATGGDSFLNASAYAAGLFLDNSTVTINGNGNSFSATATGGEAFIGGNASASANGVDLGNSSMLTISGNSNSFSATATGGTIFSPSPAIGSGYGNGTTTGSAYGIVASDSIINFLSTATGTQITVGGSNGGGSVSYGIFADTGSALQVNGSNVIDSTWFANTSNVSFTRTGAGGNKVEWNGIVLGW